MPDLSMMDRLLEFARRLLAHPAFDGFQSGWDGLAKVMTEVEDELSGIAKQETPDEAKADGRLYPPVLQREKPSGAPGVRSFRVKGHFVSIADNGAIEIVKVDKQGQPIPGAVLVDKPGADGRLVSNYRRTQS